MIGSARGKKRKIGKKNPKGPDSDHQSTILMIETTLRPSVREWGKRRLSRTYLHTVKGENGRWGGIIVVRLLFTGYGWWVMGAKRVQNTS